jgi:cytochrome c-type biogenesis protein CcmH
MSPRDSFWFLAGALVAVAIMVTVRAWLRQHPALDEPADSAAGSPSAPAAAIPASRSAGRPSIPSFAVPIAAALALVGVALGIYFLLGSPESITSSHGQAATQLSKPTQMGQSSATAGSLDDVTNKLAARLAAKGGSDNDWKLLAESYEYMGRTADAAAAKAHIASATPAAATAGDAGAEGTQQATGEQLAAGQMSADQMGDLADALDKPGSGKPASDKPPALQQTGTTAAGSTTAPGGAEISGTVEITSRLARQATTGATLFIYAKQPNAPGPPLAVLRVRAEHWPVTFTLNDGNAMVPGRNLSNANDVQIEARISKNGDALPQSGDLVGSVTSVNPRGGHPVKISIDREIG